MQINAVDAGTWSGLIPRSQGNMLHVLIYGGSPIAGTPKPKDQEGFNHFNQ
jgi:hypothetical protein